MPAKSNTSMATSPSFRRSPMPTSQRSHGADWSGIRQLADAKLSARQRLGQLRCDSKRQQS